MDRERCQLADVKPGDVVRLERFGPWFTVKEVHKVGDVDEYQFSSHIMLTWEDGTTYIGASWKEIAKTK